MHHMTQADLVERARDLVDRVIRPRAAEWDRNEAYPWPVVAALTEAGFMGMTIPRSHGGPGRSIADAVLVIEEVARACALSARIVVEANMGAISAVMAYGTEAQKRLGAAAVLAGDKPAICITEPGAGSAATDMTTRADRRGDRYILNGHKHWITGGGVSRLHLIFARVYDEQGHEEGIGGFLALRDPAQGILPRGLVIAGREATMGLRGMPEATILCEDLEIPADMALCPPGGFRRGFADLINAYNCQRVGAATVALGIAAGAFELARDQMNTREQFGRPIAEFQGLQWMLADMAIGLEAARAMIHRAATSRGPNDSPFPDPTQAAMAKILASETALKVTNDALQIFGASGYSRDLPLERMVRDARMFTIAGGTAQILRNMVAASALGMKLPQTRDGYTNRPAMSEMAR